MLPKGDKEEEVIPERKESQRRAAMACRTAQGPHRKPSDPLGYPRGVQRGRLPLLSRHRHPHPPASAPMAVPPLPQAPPQKGMSGGCGMNIKRLTRHSMRPRQKGWAKEGITMVSKELGVGVIQREREHPREGKEVFKMHLMEWGAKCHQRGGGWGPSRSKSMMGPGGGPWRSLPLWRPRSASNGAPSPRRLHRLPSMPRPGPCGPIPGPFGPTLQ